MSIETKFLNTHDQVIEVVVYGDIAYPVGSEINITKLKLFDTKFDAMYDKFLENVSNGKPYTNYKVSPYYEQYIERLKKEHPEYFI